MLSTHPVGAMAAESLGLLQMALGPSEAAAAGALQTVCSQLFARSYGAALLAVSSHLVSSRLAKPQPDLV